MPRLGAHGLGPLNSPWFREVVSPIEKDQLRPLDPRCERIQFSSALTEGDFKRLSSFMRDYPDVALRAYGAYDGSIPDLDSLKHFLSLRRFDAEVCRLENLDGLAALPLDLTELEIGRPKRRLSLAPLARFEHLDRLYLEGHTKHLQVIQTLTRLRWSTLRSITLPDLKMLAPLTDLRALALKLGGTHDLSFLPHVGRLEYIELWMIRGPCDISALGEIPTLRYLFLQALKRVNALPDLSQARALVWLRLETMKSIADFDPIAAAPALEELQLIDMRQATPELLARLVGHPTLRAATVGTGSKRRNEAIAAMLGLPRAVTVHTTGVYELPSRIE